MATKPNSNTKPIANGGNTTESTPTVQINEDGSIDFSFSAHLSIESGIGLLKIASELNNRLKDPHYNLAKLNSFFDTFLADAFCIGKRTMAYNEESQRKADESWHKSIEERLNELRSAGMLRWGVSHFFVRETDTLSLRSSSLSNYRMVCDYTIDLEPIGKKLIEKINRTEEDIMKLHRTK
jgi:hypothetical protein